MACEICGKDSCDCSMEQRDITTDVSLAERASKETLAEKMKSFGGDFAWSSGLGRHSFRCVGECGAKIEVQGDSMDDAVKKAVSGGWTKRKRGLSGPRYPHCFGGGAP